jgi:uncharacterized membrane protein YkoI
MRGPESRVIAVAIAALALNATACVAATDASTAPLTTTHAQSALAVTRAHAAQLALERAPSGVIKTQKLVHVDGRPVWDIHVGEYHSHNVMHVRVDAADGEVLSSTREDPAQLKHEKRENAAVASGTGGGGR